LRLDPITFFIAQGENPKFIQSQLGHHSITMTMDTYGHLFPDCDEGVGERIDGLVFGNNLKEKQLDMRKAERGVKIQ